MADLQRSNSDPAGDVAPDGSPVALYLALRGDEEAAFIHGVISPDAAILELGSGVGRVTRHLVALGHSVTAVDNSSEMLGHLDGRQGVETVLADMGTLDLSPRQWPVVLLASHAVNDELGPAFLATAARHLGEDGCVILERHEPGWVGTVEASTSARDGVRIAICDIERRSLGTLQAMMVYEIDGHRYEQRFTAHEVDDHRLAELASQVGLRVDSMLGEGAAWVRLVRL